MSDWEALFLVLGAIYLSECIAWVPRGNVALLSWFGKRFAPRAPFSVIGNARGGFVLASPLPPLGSALLVRGIPFSLSSEGALSFVSSSLDPNGRSEHDVRCVRFDAIPEGAIKARDKEVRIDGTRFVSCGSESSARRWASLLTTLRDAKPKARAKLIDSAIAESMDIEAIALDRATLAKWSWPARLAANLVFLQLFAVLPAFVYVSKLEPRWINYAIGLGLSTLWTVVLFFVAHRKLFPSERVDRWTQSLLMLAPPAAIRAHDKLARRNFLDRHPLAVARVLCTPRALETFARSTLLDARFPIAPPCPLDDPNAIAIEADFRARMLRAIERTIENAGLELDALVKTPAKLDPGSVAFCPRCRAEFTKIDASCASCGGLALTSF